ncbi:hypothetical protein NL676_009646 [Syzygium grande]|nr:hypothetical protein NL676_009646 [Syzygium grande]
MSFPYKLVRKTSGEYLSARSFTNFSGQPLLPAAMNSRVSPRMGHPLVPGGGARPRAAAATAMVATRYARMRGGARQPGRRGVALLEAALRLSCAAGR